ncbi:MAG: lysophospholipase [Spirochaetaceae bacterium]|jgi:alpha-beta hydrolase superfamily lysophospholipase|nr:lysophospholipase [Spirochaetaceae bacterium]
MVEQEVWLETTDGIRLFVRKWLPNTSVRAVINIVHGMAEHSGRYRHLGEFFCEHGIAIWCADQRGHGKTAEDPNNDEKEGGLSGHCADRHGFRKVLHDIDMVHKTIIKHHKNLPLFVLGHSWGSFLVQGYIEFYGGKISGAILSGTRGPGGVETRLGVRFLIFLTKLCGVRTRLSFVNAMILGRCLKTFAPCRTRADWLSRDEAAVDAALADPLYGQLPTLGFFRDMLYALNLIHKNRAMEKISRSLPVYVLGGDRDPVGEMGESVNVLIKKYVSLGIKDLSFVLYPGARHECFNEINRDEVLRNLLLWLEKHL